MRGAPQIRRDIESLDRRLLRLEGSRRERDAMIDYRLEVLEAQLAAIWSREPSRIEIDSLVEAVETLAKELDLFRQNLTSPKIDRKGPS